VCVCVCVSRESEGGVCLKIRRRYFCRRGHFKGPIYETFAETRGIAGPIKSSTKNVHSIHVNEIEGIILK
jgi:hypothetical protein